MPFTVFARMLVLTCLGRLRLFWSCSGYLQVGAGASPSRCVPPCGQRDSDQTADVDGEFCETDRLHEVLETKTASSLVAESDQLHAVLESTAASWLVAGTDRLHEVLETMALPSLAAETDRLHVMLESTAAPSFATETDELHAESESSGARVCWHSGGHSAWRGRVGGLRLRRQAHSRLGDFVVDLLSSSHLVDHIHTRSVGYAHGEHELHDARSNSCLGTHVARGELIWVAQCTRNSGEHANSYRCTCHSCGGVRGGTKPLSMSTRCQDRCLAVEKLASLQQAPGRLRVQTWAGRDGNPSLPISQVVEIMPGVCGHGDSPSPSFLLFRVAWAGQRS